ncbi:4-alpha-glucanotransferase [Granulicella tundricola]|uniref:4-alpha-glucanotransferase n=1 Tax=Granulicella tundricola (strain ATCC BAA-1859 / DSM 23138 / MP5ACTX9) TaxID=1198114 RepID=E8X4E0_GRATM|nr:4-alpha-glucanotransferase [Granulicella tundricola]ADW68267.1 4-alpha-glucanotransferase [Granulicella tundricola MP5ACTX9]
MLQERVSGVLLHVTSLPSYGGIGDFGPEAYNFVDFLAASKQRIWQVLPLSPTGYGSSPYSALSAFAGNPILISLEILADQGWIDRDRIANLAPHSGPCDFGRAATEKLPLVEEAAANFLDRATGDQRLRFQKFCTDNHSWLSDYAMFTVLRRTYEYASWHEWPEEYARRKSDALATLMNERGRELAIEQAVQFLFSEQWCTLRGYCADRKIQILGDVAIFVNYDSADVWTNPDIFELDDQLRPIRVSGVPPDYFSATGQRWGNPLYRWSTLKERGFDWWVARIRRSLTLYDVIRLDHFRGFEAFWSIAADEETAINGQWVKAPGHDLFQRLRDVFGDLPFVAEDLGVITKEVDELREHYGMPGMRILQFGFTDRGSHLYLPHRFVPNTVTYTGTHDNNTTLGWWLDDTGEAERANAQTYLGKIDHPAEIVWAMMRAAARSVANVCIFPLQDILHLGSDARMNTPAGIGQNWAWRYDQGTLHPDFAYQLGALMEMTDRDGYSAPVEGTEAAGKPTEDASKRAELGTTV